MKIQHLFLMLAAVILSLSSCKKNDPEPDPTPDPEFNSVTDNSTAENAFNDAFSVVLDAGASNGMYKIGSLMTVCADITLDTSANPDKLTLDFGAGCTGSDNRTRAGIIEATFTGRYRDSGTIITISPKGYTVDGYLVEGTKTVTNMGNNPAGNPYYKISIVGGKVTAPNNGGTIEWESEREREWSEGHNTPFNILDDVYLISGTGKGKNLKGELYDFNIKNPLKVKIGCRHIVSGVLDVTPAGHPTRSIDYGNGDCDGNVAVTVDGKVYNITVK